MAILSSLYLASNDLWDVRDKTVELQELLYLVLAILDKYFLPFVYFSDSPCFIPPPLVLRLDLAISRMVEHLNDGNQSTNPGLGVIFEDIVKVTGLNDCIHFE